MGDRVFRGSHVLWYSALLLLPLFGTATYGEEVRPWELTLQLFSEYDSNVSLAGNTTTFAGSADSLGAGVALAGTYRFVQNDSWEVGAGGRFIQTYYFESDVDNFNLTSLSPSAYVDYFFNLGGLPMTAEAAYSFRQDWLGEMDFENSNDLQFSLQTFPINRLRTRILYGVSFDEFAEDGPNPAVTSRDATQHRVGADATYFLSENQSIGGTVLYRHNDAEGMNFTFDSWMISAQFNTHIAGPLSGELSGGYSNEDYTRFTTTPQRTQDNLFVCATLYLAISREVMVNAYYSYLHMDGSTDQFTLDRNIVGVGLTYRP